MRRTFLFAALGCVVALVGCKKHEAPKVTALPHPLVVEFAGCVAVTIGPVCELGAERAVRLWVNDAVNGADAGDPATPVILGPDPITVSGAMRMSGGWMLPRVVLPAEAKELRVEAGPPASRHVFTLRVAPPMPMPWFDEAKALREKGKLDEAAARLEPGLHAEGAPRVRALGLLARIELARGQWEQAATRFQEAIARGRETGRISDVGEDSFALAFTLSERGYRYADAHRALDAIADVLVSYPEGRAREPYGRALIARQTGDLRTSLAMLATARERASRLGMARLLLSAQQAEGLLLNELGRFDEALARFADAAGIDQATPCDKVTIATNIGQTLLLARDARGAPFTSKAVTTLEGALPLLEGPCQDALQRGRLFSALALAELQSGDLAAASAHLARSRENMKAQSGSPVLFGLELEGRIALAKKDTAGALAAFAEEARHARGSLFERGSWTATMGRGAALEARGDLVGAAQAYAEAEAALDDASLFAPLGEGRETYVGERETSAKRGIDVLLRLGRTRDAMEAARRSLRRILSAMQRSGRLESLDRATRSRWEEAIGAYRRGRDALDTAAANDWQLSALSLDAARAARQARERQLRTELDAALGLLGRSGARAPSHDALSPPPAGTLHLVYHPLETGWVGFAEDAQGIVAARLGPIDAEGSASSLAHPLLDPFRASIDRNARLRVMAFGALRKVDLHALPWNGASLLDTKEIEYAVDITPSPSVIAPMPRAVIVADPTDDLASASAEGLVVDSALRARGGWQVDLLRGREASSRALLERLTTATLFHYAGHGAFTGREGWESALPLGAGSHVTVGDILALPRAPAIVVLSACEGARTSSNAAPEGLGLAHAFVASGAAAVIAPTRNVPDRLAAEMARLLYQDSQTSLDADPAHAARALRRAALDIRAAAPDLDWAAFRVVTP